MKNRKRFHIVNWVLAVALVCTVIYRLMDYETLPVHAQQRMSHAPDCMISFSFTAAGSTAGPGSNVPYFDNRGTACTTWTLLYQSTGFSALSIQVDEAPLNASTDSVGTFVVWPSTNIYSGSLPLTTTSVSQISMYGYHPYVRVTLNSKTGTGRVYGTLMGWQADAGYDVNQSPVPVIPWTGGTLVSGVVTTPMTLTTSTEVIPGAASNYLYITYCETGNDSTTVSTRVNLQNGSGGTVLTTLPAPAAAVATTGGGGGSYPFGSTPLKVPTAGNGLYAANVTTGSATTISCIGFKSPSSY